MKLLNSRLALTIGLTAFFCLPVYLVSREAGPLPRRTGGPFPGELNCTQGQCHVGAMPDSGPGAIAISVNGVALENYRYTPGEMVPVVVTVSDPDASQTVRGFEFSARSIEGCFQAGRFTLLEDEMGIQIRNQGRARAPAPCPRSPLQFPEHTMPHEAVDGAAQFTFNWTAPATNAGPIVMAAAGNAANGDGTRMGDRIYLTSATVLPEGAGIVSAASLRGPTFSANQIVSVFADGLTQRGITTGGGAAQSRPLPTSLAGLSATVTDSAGDTRAMPLLLAINTQVNGLIPDGTAAGTATLSINTSGGGTIDILIEIAAASPGIFTADNSGSGLAAAAAVTVDTGGNQTPVAVLAADGAGGVTAVAIDVSGDDAVVVLLFGTGIRDGSAITATINGDPAAVVGSGASSEFSGLDQVNVQIDPSLAGSGDLTIQIRVDGVPANAVTVNVG